jgi:hypothetical protein
LSIKDIADVYGSQGAKAAICHYDKNLFSNGVYGFVDYTDLAGSLSISIVEYEALARENSE